MEILIACLIATLVVKNGLIDAAYAARGKPSPRRSVTHDAYELLKRRAASSTTRQAADAPRPSGLRGYATRLWEDSWDEARDRHDRRLHRRRQRRTERATQGRPTGALRRYLRTVKDDGWASWDRTWDDKLAKRHERRTAGQAQALAAALIAATEATNANRTSHHPDEPDAPQPASGPAIAADVGRAIGRPEVTNPRWVCPECGEEAVRIAPNDLTPQQRDHGVRPSFSHRDGTQLCPVMGPHGYEPAEPEHAEEEAAGDDDTGDVPAADRGQAEDSADQQTGGVADTSALATVHPLNGSTNGSTQEAPVVTTTSGETNTLSQTLGAINSWEASTQQAITSLETSIANLRGSDVGPSVTEPLGKAQEAFTQALAAFAEARDGLDPSAQIGDMYHSNPDAGDRDFVTG